MPVTSLTEQYDKEPYLFFVDRNGNPVTDKITAADFEGWVQERGLYFLGDLDPHYTPLIAWNDPGEQPLNGGLVTCDHGKGRYVYTGISFFRQLPAGVPGAYRLFANLISKRGID